MKRKSKKLYDRKPTNLYELYKWCKVDADSVADFIARYGKPERYAQRGEEYMEAVIKSHVDRLKLFGFTFISHHDSRSGETVAFYRKES